MSYVLTLKRRHEPPRRGDEALLYFGLIAASGFATGWVARLLGF